MKEQRPRTPYETRIDAFDQYVVQIAEEIGGDQAYAILEYGERAQAALLAPRGTAIEPRIKFGVYQDQLRIQADPKIMEALQKIGFYARVIEV